jgi:hypothetical protein
VLDFLVKEDQTGNYKYYTCGRMKKRLRNRKVRDSDESDGIKEVFCMREIDVLS